MGFFLSWIALARVAGYGSGMKPLLGGDFPVTLYRLLRPPCVGTELSGISARKTPLFLALFKTTQPLFIGGPFITMD